MSRRLYVVALVLVIVAIFASASFEWLRSLGRTAVTPAAPLQSLATSSRGFFGTLSDIGGLRTQVAELEAKNATLKAEAMVLRELVDRDDRLKQEHERTAGFATTDLVAARVVARSPLGAFDELVVNVGLNEGVVAGQPVLKTGHLIGVIREVSKSRSTLTLLTSVRTTIPVVLQHSRGQGIVRGGLEGLVITDLPIDVKLTAGEAVLTSGVGELLPPDIPVGSVGAVVSQSSEILQRVTLASPIHFSSLEEVLIVVGTREDS